MPVIPTSEGRLILVPEGVLRLPLPTPVPPKPPKKYKTHKTRQRRIREVPGYMEWFTERSEQLLRVRPVKRGRRIGQPAGWYEKDANEAWVKARELAKRDMEKIKKTVELDARAEEALESALEVMRSPMSQGTKLAAAKLVLEYTKAKPASESKVTVNAAEAWLASIAESDDDTEGNP